VTIDRFFDWFQLAAVACLLCLGVARAVMLYARGVRVVVVDWQRTLTQMLCDLLLVTSLLLLFYHIVVYSWPLPDSFVVPSLGTELFDSIVAKAIGALLVTAALVIYGLALRAFGNSWRMGIDRESPGSLVTTGVFAWTRNPIYVALDLLAIGVLLLQGRLIFLVVAAIFVLMIHELICREERFLRDHYGDAYRSYCARVGRYVTMGAPRHR
jgi:protein-S-isoprenylcysteine O-methyltransferase Ste14